jgi:hypothetical protein
VLGSMKGMRSMLQSDGSSIDAMLERSFKGIIIICIINVTEH